MAVVRAHIAKIPIVLASATPSVETEVNARKGRYQRVALPSRFGGQHMPHIEAIDLRRAPPPRGRFISPPLAEQIQFAIEKARAGAVVPQPPRLRAADAVPGLRASLCLHHLRRLAGRSPLSPAPGLPPLRLLDAASATSARIAQAEESLVAVGPGVERLQEEAAALFPEARTMVLSSDLITSIETMRSELNEIAEGRVDIIIGTQLVAKGHNFPRLNLVGVVDADLGLGNGDPRAAERTFQLLNQVIGRAGPRPGPRRRLSADPSARTSRDEGAGRERPRGVLCQRDRGARARRLSAVRPARQPDHFRGRPADRGRFCAQARRDRADRRAHPGAGTRRSAARGHQGPLPVPPAGEVAAQCRPVGIFARMAGRRARRPRAISSSRSTSIRRAFCEVQFVIPGRAKSTSPECIARRQMLYGSDAAHPGPRNDGDRNKKACRHLRRQAFVGARKFCGRYATQRLPN